MLRGLEFSLTPLLPRTAQPPPGVSVRPRLDAITPLSADRLTAGCTGSGGGGPGAMPSRAGGRDGGVRSVFGPGMYQPSPGGTVGYGRDFCSLSHTLRIT